MNESSKRPSSKPNAAVVAAQAVLARRSNEQIPLSLGKASLRMRLEAYYSLIAPDILSNRTEWLRKYDQIYEKVGQGYLAQLCFALIYWNNSLTLLHLTEVRWIISRRTKTFRKTRKKIWNGSSAVVGNRGNVPQNKGSSSKTYRWKARRVLVSTKIRTKGQRCDRFSVLQFWPIRITHSCFGLRCSSGKPMDERLFHTGQSWKVCNASTEWRSVAPRKSTPNTDSKIDWFQTSGKCVCDAGNLF